VISGEHGIGSEKNDFMQMLFNEADLDAMRRLRAVFDPDGVCNPGKVFPSTPASVEENPRPRDHDSVPFG